MCTVEGEYILHILYKILGHVNIQNQEAAVVAYYTLEWREQKGELKWEKEI